MKTMEFCSGSMLHGFQGNPWNFPHAFSMAFPWFSHAFSTRGVKNFDCKVKILVGQVKNFDCKWKILVVREKILAVSEKISVVTV